MDTKRRTGRVMLAMAALTAALTFTALPGAVAAKDGDIIRTGACTLNSDWKLKLSPENGRIEVEFEVDSNRVGQTWNVAMRHNGVLFFQGSRVTQAPSGSFTVRRIVNNLAGDDRIVGRAVNPRSGEVCRGVATFPA